MKPLILLLFLLCSIVSFGQGPGNISIGHHRGESDNWLSPGLYSLYFGSDVLNNMSHSPKMRIFVKSDDIIKSDYLLIFQLKYVEKTEIKDKPKEWITLYHSGYSEPIDYGLQTKIFYTKGELETFINSSVMDIYGVYEVVRKMEITNENNLYKIKNSNQ